MLDFLLHYSSVGFILSIFLNLVLWALHRPLLGAMEVFACTILWPITLTSLINTLNGVEEEIEE
jgi:hypothetical protein